MVVADVDVDRVVAVCTADLLDPGQVHYFRMLAQVPDIRFITCQAGTVDTALLAGTDTDGLPILNIAD